VPWPTGDRSPYQLVYDLTVDPAGRIHLFQFGSDYPGVEAKTYVSTYTPSLGTWEHHTRPGLYPVGGGISIQGNYLYYGITRFNINDWTTKSFITDLPLYDVYLGQDGLLYGGWVYSPRTRVYVLDPSDYGRIREFDLGDASGLSGVTANADGDLFVASSSGRVYRYDSAGHLLNAEIGSPRAHDLDLSRDGILTVGHGTGDVDVFDDDLRIITTFNVGFDPLISNYVFTAFSTYQGGPPNTIELKDGQLVQPLNLGVRNDSPSVTLALSSNEVAENSANGTVIGSFSAGGDFQSPMSFSLVDSAQERFAAVGDKLQVANGKKINYEQQSSYYVTVRAVDYFGVSLDKAFRIDILDVNEPPTARAGGPYAVRAGTSITLDGSGSDPEQSSGTLVYEWDLDDDGVFGEIGDVAERGAETGTQPVFRAVGLVGPTTYPISLRVTDQGGLTNTATVNVRIDENKPPVAVAGGPYVVRENLSTTLDGSGSSDPERPSDTLIYVWDLDGDGIFGELGAAAVRGDEIGVHPAFSAIGLTAPLTVPISLRVTDDGGASDIATADIQIVKNVLPTANAGGPYRVLEGRTKSLDASRSSDPEQPADTLVYEWDLDGDSVFGEVDAAALRGDETGIRPVFSAAGLLAPLTISISLKVTDDVGAVDIDTAELVIAKNEPPTAALGGPYSVVLGNTVVFDASGSSDRDQVPDSLIYQWDLDGDGVFGESGLVAARGDELGMQPLFSAAAFTNRTQVPVALRVTDDGGLTAEGTTTVYVTLPGDPKVSNGELRIVGSNAADVITIGLVAPGAELEVEVNGDVFRFLLADVTSYFVDAGSGDDSVSTAENVGLRGRILGGHGNDVLNGGGGDEEIFGGDGDDRLNAGAGDDYVYGETGNDVLLASRGRDVLRPGSGSNSIQLGAMASSLRMLSLEGSVSENVGRNRRRPTSSSNLAGQIAASLDAALSGSVSLTVSDSDTGTIDGRPCTADLSVSASGTVKRLKYRANLSGSVVVSCAGLGNANGSVTGSASGAVSLQKGVVSLRGAMEISFGGQRRSRSSITGSASISELITDVS
jgi:hypothetical protein